MAEKNYRDERFEFALFVNDNIICKRNFKINNFIEHSMDSLDFKELVDEIVDMIDNDLKSKSRVYTWYYGDVSTTMQQLPDEFKDPLAEPWTSTFKFVIYDNKKPVIQKIWDGRFYPKAIRDHVDIANRNVRIMGKDGKPYVYDKNEFFQEKGDKLNAEMCCLKAMVLDKDDLLSIITKRICETCSSRDSTFSRLSDYTIGETYGNDAQTKKNSEKCQNLRYKYSLDYYNNKVEGDWGKAMAQKTREYFKNLY